MAVAISTEPRFRPLAVRELFVGDYREASIPMRGFDVTRNGQRFLMKASGPAVESAPLTSINVVLNWTEELKRLAPTK